MRPSGPPGAAGGYRAVRGVVRRPPAGHGLPGDAPVTGGSEPPGHVVGRLFVGRHEGLAPPTVHRITDACEAVIVLEVARLVLVPVLATDRAAEFADGGVVPGADCRKPRRTAARTPP